MAYTDLTSLANFFYKKLISYQKMRQLANNDAFFYDMLTGTSGPLSGFRNKIINGNFDVWQRGTSFAAIASGTYTADRFSYQKNGAMVHTVERSIDVPTVAQSGMKSNYSIKADCTTVDAAIAAGELCGLRYVVEGYDFKAIAQRAFTLTFWVKATKTGTYCVSFRNSGADRSYVAEYTVTAADTWEKKSITVTASPSAGTWDYINGVGVYIDWVLAMGSTYNTTAGSWQAGNFQSTANQVNATDNVANDFFLAQVQIEAGAVATAFEERFIGTELNLCQRYYEKSFPLATAPAQAATTSGALHMNQVVGASTNMTGNYVMWAVRKRASPTVTLYNTNNANAQVFNASAGADCSSTAPNTSTETGSQISLTTPAGSVAGQQLVVHWTASAEL